MALTIEEIQAAVKENPELETALVTYSAQTETGKTLLNNHLTNNKDSISKTAADEATKAAYGNMDKILKDAGYEKQEGEFTTAAQARAIKGLEAKIAKSGASAQDEEAAQAMIQAVKDQADEEKRALQGELETERTNNTTNNIKSKLIGARSKLTINPTYEKLVADSFIVNIEKQLIDGAKKQADGTFIYHDEKGLPYLNDLRAPATEEQILSKLLKPILVVSEAGGGAGQEKPSSTIVGGNLKLNGSYGTQVELYTAFEEAAKAQALAARSEEFNKQWELVKKQHDYGNLKRK